MKASSRFAGGLLAGLLLVTGSYALWVRSSLGRPTTPLADWCHEIAQKKQQIAARIQSPKLLIVAGSSALFGISAEIIEKEIGCPAVNLGTHAGLGTDYLLHCARQAVRPGDTVLLAFEYELYDCGGISKNWPSAELIDYATAWDPDYVRNLGLEEKWNLLMLKHWSTPHLLGGHKQAFQYYSADCIDAWGDQIHHSAAERPASVRPFVTCNLLQKPSVRLSAFDSINAFCQWAGTNHIQVLATFPAICHENSYDLPLARQAIESIVESYRRLQVPVLGEPGATMLPREQFFDTYYHLTEEACRERTRKLVPLLRPALNPTLVQHRNQVFSER